jgi:nucleoside-diphosphate-sugar epimerase
VSADATKLVIGASGFVGSHVTRQLAERGDDVRVTIRKTSSTEAISDLDVEYRYGDIFDDRALREAMQGCDVVFYCVVTPVRGCAIPLRCSRPTSRVCVMSSTLPPGPI